MPSPKRKKASGFASKRPARYYGRALYDESLRTRRDLRRMALRLLFECGWRPVDVARELDVDDSTVSQWKHRYKPAG